jgi:hypothetical protein
MSLKNVYKNKKNFYIILIILMILHQSNVFEKFYIMSKFSLKERLTKSYGYCDGASFGFIDDIFKENSIKENIEIINDDPNVGFANSIWFKFKINQPVTKEKVILLNNKNSLEFFDDKKVKLVFRDTDYGFYKIKKRIDNCYYLIR